MPSIGHIAVGAAAGRLYGRDHPEYLAAAMALFSAASLLPDADGIAFRLGISYGAPFGHRGASHSLAAAVLIGILTGLAGRVFRMPAGRTTLFATPLFLFAFWPRGRK